MSRRVRVLLAEDDPSVSSYMQLLLNRWDCEIVVVPTAEDAVRRAAGFEPDIALLGFVTPGMGGATAGVSLLRVCPSTKVVLTVESVPAQIVSDLWARGYDFHVLAAPFKSEELRAMCFPNAAER